MIPPSEPIMPILMPEDGRSAWRWVRVRRMNSRLSGFDSATSMVDWIVSAVGTEVPKSPCAAKVWRSAVRPAPELGSCPAMVKTTVGLCGNSWLDKAGKYGVK